MIKVLICSFSLLLANIFVEWGTGSANYMEAWHTTWHQFVAIAIFFYIWIKPDYYEILSRNN